MTPEQVRLVAAILHGLCSHCIVPYYDERGKNVGQCSVCGARGEPTPDGTGLQWTHDEQCAASLDAELQELLQDEQASRSEVEAFPPIERLLARMRVTAAEIGDVTDLRGQSIGIERYTADHTWQKAGQIAASIERKYVDLLPMLVQYSVTFACLECNAEVRGEWRGASSQVACPNCSATYTIIAESQEMRR